MGLHVPMPANARRGKRRGRPGAAAAAIAVVAVTDEELALVDGGSDDVGEWGSGTVPVPGSTTLSQGRGAATARSPEPSGSARVTVDTADAGAASVRSGSAAADETRSAKTLSPAPSPTPDQTATNDGGGGSGSGSDGPAASSGTTALRAAAAAAAAVHSAAVAGSDRITELSKGVRKYVPTAATLARAKKRSADDASGHRLAAIVTTLQAACFLFSLIVLLPDDSGGLTQGHGDQPVVVRTPSQTAIAGPNSTFSPGLVNTTYDGLRLCPRPTICSESTAQVWWLALSRGTAYWMFPVLGVVFVTKLRAFNTLLSSTVVTLWIPLGDLHDMHTRVGNTIGWATFLHTLGHVVRWADREELATRLSDQVGLSGAIAAVMCIPIIVPMTLVWCRRRNRVKWETRKHLHLLAGLFGIALAFHTPNLGGLMGACVAAYGLDVLYATFWMTFRVTSSKFTRLGSGTQLTFQNPAAWAKTGGDVVRSGYVNVAVPWISKTQWHPFSLYPNPREADASAVFIMAAGDWSRALHRSIERPTTRPVWIQGPFSSPYDAALDYDNLLLVASGIGITPALSCIQLLKDDRRISLVWMCRDPCECLHRTTVPQHGTLRRLALGCTSALRPAGTETLGPTPCLTSSPMSPDPSNTITPRCCDTLTPSAALIEFFLDTFNLGDEVDVRAQPPRAHAIRSALDAACPVSRTRYLSIPPRLPHCLHLPPPHRVTSHATHAATRHQWVLIHYTGRTPMNLDHRKLTPNTIIVPSRPDLYKVLPDVIMSVEEKADLPARVVVQSMQFVDAMKDVATSLEAASGGDRAPPPVRRVRAVMRSCLAQGLTAGQLLGMFDRNEDGACLRWRVRVLRVCTGAVREVVVP